MRPVLTQRALEGLLAKGGGLEVIPVDAVLTPSARDFLNDLRNRKQRAPGSGSGSRRGFPADPTVPDFEYHWKAGSDPSTDREIEQFFNSPAIEELKEKICEIGSRMWKRNYVDGNGGNITVRVGDNLVLCTPTLISKGFMRPQEMCLVDFEGRQLAGSRKRTSEVNTHIGIMRYQPKAKACVHAHPPYATAFAVASVQPPTCMIPEAEVFLGQIGISEYETPGTPENSEAVGRMAVDHQAILMQNHGVITWGKDVEDSYWKMENTDSYCQTVWIASQLGSGPHQFSPEKLKDLIRIREQLGMEDKRSELKECELCDNAEFRPGVVCRTDSVASRGGGPLGEDSEALVSKITDLIMEQLQ
jgi:L-fuculose-phosphate aldolase